MIALHKVHACIVFAMALLGGCGEHATPTTTTNVAASASNIVADAAAPKVRPTLARITTPTDKRKGDEAACGTGNAEACRAMADRYRGYGHVDGCGIERKTQVHSISLASGTSLSVRIKRISEDWENNEEAFTSWIAKACDLGHAEACSLDRDVVKNFRTIKEKAAEDMALRSNVETSALFAWRKAKSQTSFEYLLGIRKTCVGNEYNCHRDSMLLYLREYVKKPPTELEPATREAAEAILTKTLDARTVILMLEKNGYTPEMLVPVREHAAKVLVNACLEGSCVCGDAAHFVPKDDVRRVDLARFGCENGESEGCYELGRLYEVGQDVPKDEKAARALYELACPPIRPAEWADEQKTGEYSPAACDRLAEIYEDGAMPPKNIPRARYYAELACKDPGKQYDHAPCIRLARYWASQAIRSNCQSEWCTGDMVNAMEKFYGPRQPPAEPKECERPSVKALCEKYKAEIEDMGKPRKR